MAASSVTGRGIGDSKGLIKPENNCGCGDCFTPKEKEKVAPSKSYCYVSYVKHRPIRSIKSSSTYSIKVCPN